MNTVVTKNFIGENMKVFLLVLLSLSFIGGCENRATVPIHEIILASQKCETNKGVKSLTVELDAHLLPTVREVICNNGAIFKFTFTGVDSLKEGSHGNKTINDIYTGQEQ